MPLHLSIDITGLGIDGDLAADWLRSVFQQYIRRAAVDCEGNRIGKITKVYLDDETGQPQWALVETGLFGNRQSLAPIRGPRLDGEQAAVLAVSKDQVKDAPSIDPDARISKSEEEALRQ